MKANNSNLIKIANRVLILNTIIEYSPITIEETIYKTRLSRPTVLKLLNELIEENLVYKSGFAQSLGGRQPALYSINNNKYFAIGIDFDFPPFHLAISNLKGEMLYSRHWEVDSHSEIPEILNSIVHNIEQSLIESNISKSDIIGLCVGVPAIVNIAENTAIKIDRIPGWLHIPLEKFLADHTGLNIFIRNDAHLIGMIENKKVNNLSNFLYIIYRSGIGMACFINNAIYEGLHGNAGYLGHTTIDADGSLCECGNHGCLETYCSKRSIINEYEKASGQKQKFEKILKLSDEGDQDAIAVLLNAGKYLGLGISNAIKLFDVAGIVIGDLECSDSNIFLQSIRNTVEQNVCNYTQNKISIQLGSLNKDCYGLGGCFFVIDNFLREPEFMLKPIKQS